MPKLRRWTMRTALMTTLALAATSVALTACAGAKVTWKSGVFAGYGPANIPAFASWRGTAVTSATDFGPGGTWTAMENPTWDLAVWAPVPQYQLTLTMPLWPQSGGSLAEAASGVDNAHWATLARNLVAAGMGSTILRLGWEFNGTWYAWSVRSQTDAALYAKAWRQIVDTMRTVPGQHFGFDWNPTRNPDGLDPAMSYPGDAYVTHIGLDVYDWNTTAGSTPAKRWSDLVNSRYGLAWHAKFATSHHKPLSFPEWALVYNANAPAAGGGDDPLFIQNMFKWFANHNTAYENYFDIDTSYGVFYGLTTGNGYFPKAAATYRNTF